MRAATVFNFLLEANLMASAAILLMIAFRKFLRKPLGNKLIYFLWLLIAIRLICPLAFANPLINEIRPGFLSDEGIRPIAGQIKIRLTDAIDELRQLSRGNADSIVYQGARNFVNGMYYGTVASLLMKIYLTGAGVLIVIFGISNIRFRRKLKANRIERISGKLQEQYALVCIQRGVKPIPVWFVDPLPSACLVGVFRPYIALPLTAAPQEAIHVLTHEVCHYQGKDHWFSLLRLICCVLHWFNPLVWAAAYISRTDGELACDSRVVQKLSQEDRLSYTNTLVLAASKRYAPGVGVLATGMTMTGRKLQSRIRSILNIEQTVKWLMVTTAVLASMALAAAFFTAEYWGYSKIPQVEGNPQLLAVETLNNEEEAKRYAQAFLENSLAVDGLQDAVWSITGTADVYQCEISLENDEIPIFISILKNGTIANFSIPSNADLAKAASGIYEQQEAKQAEIKDYILRFMQSTQPAVAGMIDELYYAGEGIYGTERFIYFTDDSDSGESAFWFSLQVTPQVQMIAFYMDYGTLNALADEPILTDEARQISEFPQSTVNGYLMVDMTGNNVTFGSPSADALPIADALELALQALRDIYGQSNLERFYVEYGFSPADNSENLLGVSYWHFSFRTMDNPLDHYEVVIHAKDGDVLVTGGPDDSNG